VDLPEMTEVSQNAPFTRMLDLINERQVLGTAQCHANLPK
jgi:hypothetical protein